MPSGATWLVDGDRYGPGSEEVRRLVGELPASTRADGGGLLGEEVDLDAVVLACETPPFLADRRVVVRGSGPVHD